MASEYGPGGRALSIAILIAAAFATAAVQQVAAQSPYPTRPIRLVVPSSPGGGTDISGRMMAPRLAELLGQQVVVDNRPGAGTMIGTELVAKAPPDGYTLLVTPSTLALVPVLYRKVPYDTLRDFAPVILISRVPNALVVHPSVPVRSVKELVSFALGSPGKLDYGSAGTGTSPHMSGELFKSMTRTNLLHVPYKGSGQSIISLMAGEVAVSFPSLPSAISYIKAGRMRALGVTTAARSPALPEVPAIGEIIRGYESTQWFAMVAPAGTPRPIIDRLNQESQRALKSPQMQKQLEADGAENAAGSPDELAAYIRSELEKWSKVARAAGIQPQ